MDARLPACWLLLAASVSAQMVSLQPVPGTTVLQAAVLAGAAVDSSSSGTFPGGFQTAAGTGSEFAATLIEGSLGADDTTARWDLSQQISVVVAPTTPALASCNSDLLLEVAAASPVAAIVDVTVEFFSTPGAPAPAVQVDLGDDGVAEYQAGQGAGSFPVSLGTAPMPVRLHMTSSLAVAGFSAVNVHVRVRPDDSVVVERLPLGCDDLPASIGTVPTFGSGIQVGTLPEPSLGPLLLVVGLDLQPFVLPAAATLPCVLMPRADILVPLLTTNRFVQPLPPALRPVTFWVQGVRVAPGGLLSTDAFRVDAP